MAQRTKKQCSIDGCSSPHVARGWCNKHYARWSQHGDPHHVRPTNQGQTCAAQDCERTDKIVRGLCPKHYSRLLKHGDPNKTLRIRTSGPEESFAARTEWQGGCLVWVGEIWRNGYGVINVPGGKSTGAHRYAWERTHGPIPADKTIDHICFNRRCVNVEHLRLATYAENNTHFQKPRSDNSSGYRGVSWDKRFNKYRGRVQKNGVEIHVGLFDDPKEAGIATALKRKELGFLLSQYDRDLISQHKQ